MKYIFMAGAPGSKWSSVSKNIYFSPDIDRTDASPAREYWHDASGTRQLMHMGAYFDPGMEFDLSQQMNLESKEHLEEFFDSAFSPDGTGVRIIKSHIFAHHINFIKATWPDCPVVLIHREDDACLGWWVKCGHFDITYPKYDQYYVDLRNMASIIAAQNKDILRAWDTYKGREVPNNLGLCIATNLALPPDTYFQSYQSNDIKVKVI
jgi:hypothetical protein